MPAKRMKAVLHNRQGLISALLVAVLLAADQIIKIEVKTNMCLHQSIHITDWFEILFIENNGMAYGMTFINKIVLSLFRILAVSLIGCYLFRLCRRANARTGYVVCLSLILAGAAGNIIDCLFYGMIFSPSTTTTVAQIVAPGDGYAPFLQGRVVDMFYFPIIDTTLPGWLPVWGGNHFIFFSPIFNFADACISTGVIAMLLFYRKELGQLSLSARKHKKEQLTDTTSPADDKQ